MSDDNDNIFIGGDEDEDNTTDLLDLANTQSAEAEKLGKPKDPNSSKVI